MVKKLLLAAGIALLIILAGFLIWAYTPLGPMPEGLAALQSDGVVEVETDRWLVFRPTGEVDEAGLIIYPGGRVDPRAYAPAARAIAEQGHMAVIVPMPLNLAVFGSGRAADVIAAFPEVEQWAVGGHSLGGAMAATFANDNRQAIDGLVLWAAYPAGGDDLTAWDGAVTSISGTLDGLATPEKIDASQTLLPPDTVWVPIAGGNHAQFGWYGPQGRDNQATISREEQQRQVIAASLALLEGLGD